MNTLNSKKCIWSATAIILAASPFLCTITDQVMITARASTKEIKNLLTSKKTNGLTKRKLLN